MQGKRNKYIFVDCYATWCGPCKSMDKEVFSSPRVSSYVGKDFISVKIQMDKSGSDNENVKRWYDEAKKMKKKYSIGSFPTYLFFDPKGKVVHKAVGYMNTEKFMEECKKALNPKLQYYTVLSRYRKGAMDTSELKQLEGEYNFPGSELIGELANNYLSGIHRSSLGREDVLQFMMQYRDLLKVQKFAASYLKRLDPNKYCTLKKLILYSNV